MLVKDICSKELITVDINDDLKKAAYIMKINNIGFLPVMKDKDIVGVITDRDIVIYGISQNKLGVKDIMRTNLIQIVAKASLEDALKVFKKHKIKRLLVKDENKYAVLCISDIIRSNPITLKDEIYDVIKTILTTSSTDYNPSIDAFIL